jgi:hypothetical protein
VNAIRNTYRDWLRGETREAAASMQDIPTGDSTQAHVEAQEAAEKLIRALPSEYKKVALMQARGLTRAEMEEKGFTRRTIDESRARIKQLRKLLPDTHEFKRVLRTPMLPASDDTEESQPQIDKDIAQLEAMPKHGKDCPPCWLCKWFEGYMPVGRVSVRMQIQEPEVRDAIANTEARKVEIAEGVRNGLL